MLKKLVKKLYRGRIDIRCYERQKAIDTKQSMEITHDGKIMTLSWIEVKNKIKAKSQLFKTKTEGGRDYYLYSYNWNPDTKKDDTNDTNNNN